MKQYSKHREAPIIFRFYKVIIILIAVIIILTYLYQNSSLFYRRSINVPFSLHLNKQELYMIKGEEFRLYVFGINERVTYSTTNFRVAGVNFNGRVKAHQTGKTFIIANVKGKELKCRVYVIDLNRKSLEMRVGKSYKLRIIGSNAHEEWSSSNNKVVSVSASGKIKAKKKGHAVIYAKIKGKKLKCSVWVR